MGTSVTTPGLLAPSFSVPMKAAFARRVSVEVWKFRVEDFTAGEDDREDFSCRKATGLVGVLHTSLLGHRGGSGRGIPTTLFPVAGVSRRSGSAGGATRSRGMRGLTIEGALAKVRGNNDGELAGHNVRLDPGELVDVVKVDVIDIAVGMVAGADNLLDAEVDTKE